MINTFDRNISFKGYDARRLQGFAMSTNFKNIASEMIKIGKKEGFDLFFYSDEEKILSKKDAIEESYFFKNAWIQDYISIINKKLIYDKPEIANAFSSFFGVKEHHFQQLFRKKVIDKKHQKDAAALTSTHVPGGNFFIAKNKNGTEKVLIGRNNLNKHYPIFLNRLFDDKEIVTLPQMDYHLDLFIRPLNNGIVLVADDKLTINAISASIQKIESTLSKLSIFSFIQKTKLSSSLEKFKKLKSCFAKEIEGNYNELKTRTVEVKLKDAGYTPIRVPGRLYKVDKNDASLSNKINFINANAFINPNDELVYITNASNIEKYLGISEKMKKELEISFEENFTKFLEPFVKKEHIYYIKGENEVISDIILPELRGGIHCLCCELPQFKT